MPVVTWKRRLNADLKQEMGKRASQNQGQVTRGRERAYGDARAES